jgi:glycine/D-amino acid oxidase-like deaminating enzyme
MRSERVKHHSPWVETELPHFPVLERDIQVDVVVVGAGLTGTTAAYLLRQAGVRVALIDRAQVAGGDTSRTTAHLTYVTDQRLYHLANKLGKDAARAFWEAGAAAIDQIWTLVQQGGSDCEFRWVPGYLHGPREGADGKERDRLREDADLAGELGFDARFIDDVPFIGRAGVQFAHQAKFHPRKYLGPLLRAIPGDGSYVFESTNCEQVEQKPLTVHANGHKIRCEYLFIATHNPIMGEKGLLGATAFQTKLALYTSYVLGARVPSTTTPTTST